MSLLNTVLPTAWLNTSVESVVPLLSVSCPDVGALFAFTPSLFTTRTSPSNWFSVKVNVFTYCF